MYNAFSVVSSPLLHRGVRRDSSQAVAALVSLRLSNMNLNRNELLVEMRNAKNVGVESGTRTGTRSKSTHSIQLCVHGIVFNYHEVGPSLD